MPTKKQSLLDYVNWTRREIRKEPREAIIFFVLQALVSAFIFFCIAITETTRCFFNAEN